MLLTFPYLRKRALPPPSSQPPIRLSEQLSAARSVLSELHPRWRRRDAAVVIGRGWVTEGALRLCILVQCRSEWQRWGGAARAGPASVRLRTVARCRSQITRPAFVALRLCHLLLDAFDGLMALPFPPPYTERQMALGWRTRGESRRNIGACSKRQTNKSIQLTYILFQRSPGRANQVAFVHKSS